MNADSRMLKLCHDDLFFCQCIGDSDFLGFFSVDYTSYTFTCLALSDRQSRVCGFTLSSAGRFQGGMDDHLSTCCGSPAYAAPELISGLQYLGSEVLVILKIFCMLKYV